MAGANNLKSEVLSRQACALCGACLDWCPYIKNRGDNVALTFDCNCTDGRCYEVCPRTETDWERLYTTCFPSLTPGGEIGPYLAIYRARSSCRVPGEQDGGTVTALLLTALETGSAEAALITASSDGLLPRPGMATSSDQVKAAAGSRFIAAPTLRLLADLERSEADRLIAVTRPCQTQALRKIEQTRPGTLPKTMTVIGLFCMWSLSWRFASWLKKELGEASVSRIGIPRHGLTITTEQGEKTLPLDMVRPFIRAGCTYCLDMTSELADLSLGALEAEPGWNTLVVRTARGQELLEAACARGSIETYPYPESELARLKQAAAGKRQRALTAIMAAGGTPPSFLTPGYAETAAGTEVSE